VEFVLPFRSDRGAGAMLGGLVPARLGDCKEALSRDVSRRADIFGIASKFGEVAG
jgi:hypothetical protein